MVTSQRQNLFNEIELYFSNDYNALLAEWNANNGSGDSSSVMAGEYRVVDLIQHSTHAVELLQEALNTESWLYLPYVSVFVDYGQYNLLQVVQNLRNAFVTSNYTDAIQVLNFLVCYEKSFGIWTPSKNIEIGIREAELRKLEAEIDALQKNTLERSKNVESLILELNEVKKQINQFFTEKTEEANILSNNTQSSNTLLAEIKGTQGTINTINETVKDVNAQCKTIYQQLNSLHERAAELQSELEKKSEEIETTKNNLDAAVKEESDSIKEVYKEACKSKDKIQELMSYISDGTLAHSFNKRKKDVTKTSFIWLGLGVFASIAIVVIILNLFASSNIDQQNIWPDILVKSMKTFPIACMVVYFFKQYAKERSLTEEYAFREAVAITLKAYLDQLEGEKDDHKRNLLINTVEKLYTMPSFSTKEDSKVKIKSKDVMDITDKLLETAKILKQ